MKLLDILQEVLLQEAVPMKTARPFLSSDKELRERLITPLWSELTKHASFTSKRGDRLYFDFQSKEGFYKTSTVDKLGDINEYIFEHFIQIANGIGFINNLTNQIPNQSVRNSKEVEEFKKSGKDIVDRIVDIKETTNYENVYGYDGKVFKKYIIVRGQQITFSKAIHLLIKKADSYIGLVDDFFSNPRFENFIPYNLVTKVVTRLSNLNSKTLPDLQKRITQYNTVLSKDPIKPVDGKIIISKHPYDVVGMSTGRGWTSCMNLIKQPTETEDEEVTEQERFIKAQKDIQCDISQGSFTAYLVNSNDLNLESPIARIAIKPYYSVKGNTLYYFPEERIYGTAPPAFLSSVKDLLQKAQKHTPGLYQKGPGIHTDTSNVKGLYTDNISNKDMTKVDISSIPLQDLKATNSNFTNIDFTKSSNKIISNIDFTGSNLSNTKFTQMKLQHVILKGTNLTNADMGSVIFDDVFIDENTVFEFTNLTFADLRKLHVIDFEDSSESDLVKTLLDRIFKTAITGPSTKWPEYYKPPILNPED